MKGAVKATVNQLTKQIDKVNGAANWRGQFFKKWIHT